MHKTADLWRRQFLVMNSAKNVAWMKSSYGTGAGPVAACATNAVCVAGS